MHKVRIILLHKKFKVERLN